MTKKPGMSDEDRALVELQRRRASSEPGVDAFDTDEDRFTPVQPVIEQVHTNLCHRIPLGDREQFVMRTMLELLVPALWRHTANMEMRARQRSDSQDGALLARRVDDIESTLDEKFGRSRKNGDFGNLKGRVEQADGRRWQITVWFAGLLVTIVTSAFVLGKWIGSVESDVATLKARSPRHVSPPDYPAIKEGMP